MANNGPSVQSTTSAEAELNKRSADNSEKLEFIRILTKMYNVNSSEDEVKRAKKT